MAHYLVFIVGPDGHFTRVRDLVASNNDDALQQAQQLLGRFDLEVWRDGRFIGKVSAQKGDEATR
jgi:hypothetical protein